LNVLLLLLLLVSPSPASPFSSLLFLSQWPKDVWEPKALWIKERNPSVPLFPAFFLLPASLAFSFSLFCFFFSCSFLPGFSLLFMLFFFCPSFLLFSCRLLLGH
jgi:hypothetical protein